MPSGVVAAQARHMQSEVCSLQLPIGGASMAILCGGGVAGATGHVARPESHAPARRQWAEAAASTATAPWEVGGRPRRGGRRRGGDRRRAGHGN
eukprot:scaffold166852_cov32-Tisochrysis_lutea.AAC.5